MTTSLFRCLALAALVACGSHAPPPVPPAPPPAPAPRPAPPPAPKVDGIALKVTPGDADVAIDDEPAQKAASLPAVVALKPGIHQLVITADGYTPYRVEFSLVEGKTESFTVRLEPAKSRH